MYVLTAIPVYNEARHVASVLHEVRRYSPHILVINDGSTDGTADILAHQEGLHVITHPVNRGYGAALISAFAYARQHAIDVLITMDCDGQHEPSRIPVLLEAIHDADIVSGSRYLRDFHQDTLAPQDRRRINLEITTELNRRFGLNLTDSFCGFKAYRRAALEGLYITETGWGMPLQLWVQAARLGLRIKEVGVPRVYLDPNRAFGGVLDDAEQRLAYYQQVITATESASPAPASGGRQPPVDLQQGADAPRGGVLLVGSVQEGLSVSERTALRAPARDGAVVAEPPLHEVGAALAVNRQRLQTHADNHTLLGRPWSDLRRQARQRAIAAALDYLGDNSPLPLANPPCDTLLVAGHQPELFHPGVWVKNFALYGLAQAHHATSLNLVVDNDTVKTTALRIPTPGASAEDRPRTRLVLYDRWTGETPYEEKTIDNRALFASFAERAGALLRGWHYDPLLPSFWAEVLRQAERSPLLGECFVAARRTFERDWGCHNLEVPLSTLCRTESFAWFACDLLAYLPEFHALYNAVVGAYRRRHGIRNGQHPVPDLAAEGDWLEAPFWGWRAGGVNPWRAGGVNPWRAGGVSPRRHRVFARLRDDRLELRAGEDLWPSLPRPAEDRAEAAVKAWQGLEEQGFKIRSRALTTTLYARLFLADLFIHGIGGGKYDELTDGLIQGFYECEPPVYMVLSATRWLPLPRAAVSVEDRRRLARAVRDVHFNPQRHLDETTNNENLAELAARKQEWIARRAATVRERRERFHMLRTLTEELRHPLRRARISCVRRWRTASDSCAPMPSCSGAIIPFASSPRTSCVPSARNS